MKRFLTTATAGAMALGGATWAQADRNAEAAAHRFVACETLLDAGVASRLDLDNTADVDNLIVDSRDGRVVFAIIDTNGILGSDNKTVAVPYGALTWNAVEKKFTLEATAEQLRGLPECDTSDLAFLQDQSWYSTLTGIFGSRHELTELERPRGDEYTRSFTKASPTKLDGTIVAINRRAKTAHGGALRYSVVLEDADEARHTVYLAPVAYLEKESMVPAENSAVTVMTVSAIDAKGHPIQVARSVKAGGKTLRLRNERGIPAWPTVATRSFYMLADDMDSGKLYANGEEFGSVNEVVFEAHSGTAAFAIISVGGVLGIDDTLYPVPCSAVAHAGEHNLYIAKSVTSLELAPKLSKRGIEDLDNVPFVRSVCDFYGVKPKAFDTLRPARWITKRSAGK